MTACRLLKQQLQSGCDGDKHLFAETVATAGKHTELKALTASRHGALGDQRHLLEVTCKHEGSRCKIKWEHLDRGAVLLTFSAFLLG